MKNNRSQDPKDFEKKQNTRKAPDETAGKSQGKRSYLKQRNTESGQEQNPADTRKKSGRKDFSRNDDKRRAGFKADKDGGTDRDSKFWTVTEHAESVRRKGFSAFQLRLVNSILEDVLVMHNSLDSAYAFWFKKVKIDPVEQGFLIRQINFMFAHLNLFASVANLKRPSDFERHVGRLTFSFCAYKDWPVPELDGEEGFDRRGLKKRLAMAVEEPLLRDGCPVWLQELGYTELKGKWETERKALGEEAKRYIRTNTLKVSRDELAHLLSEEGVVTRSVAGAPLALEVTSNSALFRTKAFKEGMFEQQDAGSQLIGAFVDPKAGQRVVDACAGAGGKTLQLAAAMEGKGVIIAMDTEGWKLEDLKKRAKRAGAFNIEPRVIDSSKTIKRMHESADVVLIDAPCSGTGVLRRIPDSKWRDGREHLKELRDIQYDLLSRYSLMAKVGGYVVFSTCSILPSENDLQKERFLKEHSDQFEFVEDRQIYPSSGFDGFYMAKFKRIK